VNNPYLIDSAKQRAAMQRQHSKKKREIAEPATLVLRRALHA
jgi:hypothetical protein